MHDDIAAYNIVTTGGSRGDVSVSSVRQPATLVSSPSSSRPLVGATRQLAPHYSHMFRPNVCMASRHGAMPSSYAPHVSSTSQHKAMMSSEPRKDAPYDMDRARRDVCWRSARASLSRVYTPRICTGVSWWAKGRLRDSYSPSTPTGTRASWRARHPPRAPSRARAPS